MKALLVVDIPDNCNKSLLSKTPASITFNHGTYKTLLYVEGYLKPMPQKLNATEIAIEIEKFKVDDKLMYQVEGWNRCIDEILGDYE